MTIISIHNWNRICDILTPPPPYILTPGPIYRMIFWPGVRILWPRVNTVWPSPIVHPSIGIYADVSRGDTRSGYFGSKLVYWYKSGILVLQVLFVTVIIIMLCIFPEKNRVLTYLCNNCQHRCVNATYSTCVATYASIVLCLSPLHCAAVIYFDLWL